MIRLASPGQHTDRDGEADPQPAGRSVSAAAVSCAAKELHKDLATPIDEVINAATEWQRAKVAQEQSKASSEIVTARVALVSPVIRTTSLKVWVVRGCRGWGYLVLAAAHGIQYGVHNGPNPGSLADKPRRSRIVHVGQV